MRVAPEPWEECLQYNSELLFLEKGLTAGEKDRSGAEFALDQSDTCKQIIASLPLESLQLSSSLGSPGSSS